MTTLLASGLGVVAVAGPAHAAPIGAAMSTDYNGDGYGDLVIGEPHRTLNGLLNAGAVRAMYGTPFGFSTAGSQLFTEDTPGIPGVVAQYGDFGSVLASGNFDGDAYADVAINAREVGIDGAVVVLYGSASGLHGTSAAQGKAEMLQAKGYTPDPLQFPSYTFGESLAACDFNADGLADLAVGATDGGPGMGGGGGVTIIYGSPQGLYPPAMMRWIDHTFPGIPTDEDGEQFGAGLAAADFNGDGRCDLAVGRPGWDVNGLESEGGVVVLLTGTNGQVGDGGVLTFDEETPGVPGTASYHGHVGYQLGAGDLNGDGMAELIFVAPDLIGSAPTALTIVLMGSPTGPTVNGLKAFYTTSNDQAVGSIAVIDTDGDAYRELAIGQPRRTVSGKSNAGSVVVFHGTSLGPVAANAQEWTQDSSGVLDQADAGDLFGTSLRAIQNTGTTIENLVIGIRDESTTVPRCTRCGGISLLKGGSTGLTATGNQFFSATSLTGGGFMDGWFAATLG